MLGTSMTSNGQVTVPKEVRDALDIHAGDKVYFVADKGRAIMVPVKGDIWSLRGALRQHSGRKTLDMAKARKELKAWRSERQAKK